MTPPHSWLVAGIRRMTAGFVCWILQGVNRRTISSCTPIVSWGSGCCLPLPAHPHRTTRVCCGVLSVVRTLEFSSRTWLFHLCRCSWHPAASRAVIFVLDSFILLWSGFLTPLPRWTASFFPLADSTRSPLSALASQPGIPTLYKYAHTGAMSCPSLFMDRIADLIQMVLFSKVCFWNLFARYDLLEHMPARLFSGVLPSGLLAGFAVSRLCFPKCLESVGPDPFVCQSSAGGVEKLPRLNCCFVITVSKRLFALWA